MPTIAFACTSSAVLQALKQMTSDKKVRDFSMAFGRFALEIFFRKICQIYSECFVGVQIGEEINDINIVKEFEEMGIPFICENSVEKIISIINNIQSKKH